MTERLKPVESQLAAAARQRRSNEPYTSLLELQDAPLPARAPRISAADVFAAADELLLAGARPSVERVRMRLGRGSPNTINDHLDTWWRKLGSRLRDLPGGEFPQVPEAVAQRLLQLWNEALSAAHDSLQQTLTLRSASLDERETQIAAREAILQQEQQASAGRARTLEDALALMQRQLDEANQRARSLEALLANREAELSGVREELQRLAQDQEARVRTHACEREAATAERSRLESRYEATEARWLAEVDRARQTAKAAETHAREVEQRLTAVRKERDGAREDVQALRGKLATAEAVREQLQARLHAAVDVQRQRAAKGAPKSARPMKRKTRTRATRATP